MEKRGIVVAQPFITHVDDNIYPIQLGGEELRKYLLYWDEIDYPWAPTLEETPQNLDVQYLFEVGALKRHELLNRHLHVQNGDNLRVAFSILAQQEAFEKNSLAEPEMWSMSQPTHFLKAAPGQLKVGIEVELYNLLPVPQRDIPLNEILEFKEKRKDELYALRSYLDELYEQILLSQLAVRSKNKAITQLELSLKDVNKTLQEAGVKTSITSIKSYLTSELLAATGTGLGVMGIASTFAMNPTIAGLASAALHLSVKPMLTPKSAPTKHPFLYIDSMNKSFK